MKTQHVNRDKRAVRQKIQVKVEKTHTGFSAFAEGYPVYTTGTTLLELERNIVEAINFSGETEPKIVTRNDIRLEMDLQQFFQFYPVINARYLAERIGMNPTLLSQYVQGRKKPSQRQVDRILSGVREIGQELAELKFSHGG